MSSPDLESLRARALEAGTAMGWAPFGRAVGIDGETLRQFAKASPGRRAHPETVEALTRHFSPSRVPPEVASEIRSAIGQVQSALDSLTKLHQRLAIDSADPVDVARQAASAALAESEPEDGSLRLETSPKGRHITGAQARSRTEGTDEGPA